MDVLDEKRFLLHEQILSQILLTSLGKYFTKLCLKKHLSLLTLVNWTRHDVIMPP